MKAILPWLLAVAFAASAGALYFSASAKDQKIASLSEQVQQLDAMRTKVEDLQKQASANDERIATMQKDNTELLKLRGQVRQMQDEKAQINKQLATAQSQAERSQTEVLQAQVRASETARQMAEQQILQSKQNQGAVNACINNLRLIDAAKQQWALENNKGPDDVPQPQDLLPYIGRPNSVFPQCPGGGRYTLNAVKLAPTCSIPGHALPPPAPAQ